MLEYYISCMVQGHMQKNFVELKIPNFIKMLRIFPISWTLDPD